MTESRKIVGMIMSIAGLFLIGLTFFIGEVRVVALIYGIPLLIFGIVIFLNKKEDVIEQVKWKKK